MTRKEYGCPCKLCPSLAICRHKRYLQLYRECSLLIEYIPYHDQADKRDWRKVNSVYKALNPTVWYLTGRLIKVINYYKHINQVIGGI